MSNLIGQSLGPYQIVSELGHGGMADVYLATQPSMGREVALKVLSAHLMQERNFMERFSREVQVIAKLKHPRIVPVHDFGNEGGLPYIVMAFMEAGTLADRIREGGALPLGESVRLVAEMAEGLDYAHKRGVVHRDFKPSNVLLDSEGNAHLADFGIAKLVEDPSQLTGSGLVGTPAYMAPEMSKVGGASPLADIYSLGVTLYEMLTGERPFKGDTPVSMMMAHASDPVPSVKDLRPDLPYEVQAVLARALAKEPSMRYQKAGELAADLARAAQGAEVDDASTQDMSTTPRPTPTPSTGAARTTSKSPSRWLLGIFALVVVAGSILCWTEVVADIVAADNRPTAAATGPASVDQTTPALETTATVQTTLSVPTFTLLATLSQHRDTVRRLSFSSDGYTLASASADQTVILWDVQSGRVVQILEGFSDDATSVAFSPNQPLIAAGSLDGSILAWDVRSGSVAQTLRSDSGEVVGVDFSADGTTLVSLSVMAPNGSGTTTIWDVTTGALLAASADNGAHQLFVGDLDVSGQGLLATAGSGGRTFILDARTGRNVTTIYHRTVGGSDDCCVSFTSDGSILAAASSTHGWLARQTMSSGERVETTIIIPGKLAGFTDLDWSPDGRWLVAGTPNSYALLIDGTTLEVVFQLDVPDKSVYSVAFSPDGTILATGLDDGTILLWSVGMGS